MPNHRRAQAKRSARAPRSARLASALEVLVASFASIERADPREQRVLLLALARALRDAGKKLEGLAPPAAAADLVGALEGAIELAGGRLDELEARGVAYATSCDVPAGLPHVAGDETDLRDAFHALLLEAIDAMPAGGTLELTARNVGRWVVAGVTALPAPGGAAAAAAVAPARRGIERASAIARSAGGFVVTSGGPGGELRCRMSLPVASPVPGRGEAPGAGGPPQAPGSTSPRRTQ
jgi:hypothetical protein